MTTPVAFAHITRSPGILGGEPVVAGSGVAVRVIVQTAQHTATRDELYAAHATLPPAAIDEAFAYYAQHRDQIDAFIRANDDALKAQGLFIVG